MYINDNYNNADWSLKIFFFKYFQFFYIDNSKSHSAFYSDRRWDEFKKLFFNQALLEFC